MPFKRLDFGAHPLQIKVTYQGCAEAGLCYLPITKMSVPRGASRRRRQARRASVGRDRHPRRRRRISPGRAAAAQRAPARLAPGMSQSCAAHRRGRAGSRGLGMGGVTHVLARIACRGRGSDGGAAGSLAGETPRPGSLDLEGHGLDPLPHRRRYPCTSAGVFAAGPRRQARLDQDLGRQVPGHQLLGHLVRTVPPGNAAARRRWRREWRIAGVAGDRHRGRSSRQGRWLTRGISRSTIRC